MGRIPTRVHYAFPAFAIILFFALSMGYATTTPAPQQGEAIPEGGAEAGGEEMGPPAPAYPDIRIEVNIPATELTLFEGGVPIFTKRIAIGSGVYPTPEQESEIKRIEWNPWWYPPPGAKWAAGEKPHPPGKGNPLGHIKMPISSAILFHGTNKEWTVGRPASHGCMRMYNADAEEMGWYLQSRLSEKTDPALLDQYRKNSRTTYVVHLGVAVPVRLVYRPVVVRDDTVLMYPDYYHRLSKKNRKALLLEQLIANSIAIEEIGDAKIDALVKKWPSKTTETPVSSLLLSSGDVAMNEATPTTP